MKGGGPGQPGRGGRWRIWRRGFFFLLTAGLASALPAEDPAARVVILANSRQPESVRLAEFYAARRGIPVANIIRLPLPETESITWREFIDEVWQPVQDELYQRGWLEGTVGSQLDRLGRRRYAMTGHRMSYLVVCRGVPLRIYNDPTLPEEKLLPRLRAELNKTEAAVDAELALLAQGGQPITGLVPNPLFDKQQVSSVEEEMVVKVSRLDGPTFAQARQLVVSALAAEQTGLLGRAYVDLGGPDREGDRWLAAAQVRLQELGFDSEVERTGATFDAADRFDAPVFYFGWYTENLNGPMAREGFVFPPGAIALHIHSFSAQTLHSDRGGWCGPLVARGVTATVGNVFEPYLGFTHRPDLLLRALSEGRTFGDAVYYALPALSWQAVAIGDPLYRPFKVTLADQEKMREQLPPARAAYAVIRRAHLLQQQEKNAEALAGLRTAFERQPGWVLGLAYAQLAWGENDEAAAVGVLERMEQLQPSRPEDWALAREAAELLVTHGAAAPALRIYARLAREAAPAPEARLALLTDGWQAATAAGDQTLVQEFARQLAELGAATVK